MWEEMSGGWQQLGLSQLQIKYKPYIINILTQQLIKIMDRYTVWQDIFI